MKATQIATSSIIIAIKPFFMMDLSGPIYS